MRNCSPDLTDFLKFYKLFARQVDSHFWLLYHNYNNRRTGWNVGKAGKRMIIEIDFNSDEALYLQLCNQIIMGIAAEQFREGDSLPSVRQLAETIGINMHTVNKAYTVLKQEGYVKVDRRKGAVIAVDTDRMRTLAEVKKELQVILAKSSCKNISREEIHQLIDEIYEDYGGLK